MRIVNIAKISYGTSHKMSIELLTFTQDLRLIHVSSWNRADLIKLNLEKIDLFFRLNEFISGPIILFGH